jgi:hypothetical protein
MEICQKLGKATIESYQFGEGRGVALYECGTSNHCGVFVLQSGNPLAAGVECKFRLSQNSHFVILESVKEPGRHIGMLPNGELKSALATGKEHDAQFGVRLIVRMQLN